MIDSSIKNCQKFFTTMIKKINEFEKMMLLSLSFTVSLVAIRFLITDDVQFSFTRGIYFLQSAICAQQKIEEAQKN
jgi:cell division protein FtsL